MVLADCVIGYGLSGYGYTYNTYLSYKLQLRILITIIRKYITTSYRYNNTGLFSYCTVMRAFDKVMFSILT